MPLTHHIIPGAPDPVAPFSHAVEADGWVHLTGQMPFSGTSINEPYPQGIAAQTLQVMHNLKTVLSKSEDLDITAAITQMQKQLMSLQAAQSSFAKISELTLFSYLR